MQQHYQSFGRHATGTGDGLDEGNNLEGMFGEDGEVKADLHIDDIDELAKRYKVMKQRVETAAALTRNEATFTPAQFDPSTHTVTDAQYHEAMRQFKRNLKKNSRCMTMTNQMKTMKTYFQDAVRKQM